MSPTIQDSIALAAVAMAVAYLGRVAWSSVAERRSGACGGCAACPATPESSARQPLVALEQLAASVSKPPGQPEAGRDASKNLANGRSVTDC
jgi:hypothetical protein